MMKPEVKGSSFRKNAGLWIFFGAAMAVAVLLAVFISPWASSSPDGLEKVAEDKGFLEAAEDENPAWKHSPIPDYAVPGVKNEKAATGLSGLIGVLITLAAAVAVAFLTRGIGLLVSKRKSTGAPGHET